MMENLKIAGWSTAWIIWAVLILAAVGLFFAAIRPWFLSLEAQQNRASQQYVESVESNLYKMAADYEQIGVEASQSESPEIVQGKRAQQRAIMERAKLECAKLRPEARPSGMGKYGC